MTTLSELPIDLQRFIPQHWDLTKDINDPIDAKTGETALGGILAQTSTQAYPSLGTVRDNRGQPKKDLNVFEHFLPLEKKMAIINWLLDHGANPNQANSQGEFVIFKCVNKGFPIFADAATLHALILGGADLTKLSGEDDTLLDILWRSAGFSFYGPLELDDPTGMKFIEIDKSKACLSLVAIAYYLQSTLDPHKSLLTFSNEKRSDAYWQALLAYGKHRSESKADRAFVKQLQVAYQKGKSSEKTSSSETDKKEAHESKPLTPAYKSATDANSDLMSGSRKKQKTHHTIPK